MKSLGYEFKIEGLPNELLSHSVLFKSLLDFIQNMDSFSKNENEFNVIQQWLQNQKNIKQIDKIANQLFLNKNKIKFTFVKPLSNLNETIENMKDEVNSLNHDMDLDNSILHLINHIQVLEQHVNNLVIQNYWNNYIHNEQYDYFNFIQNCKPQALMNLIPKEQYILNINSILNKLGIQPILDIRHISEYTASGLKKKTHCNAKIEAIKLFVLLQK